MTRKHDVAKRRGVTIGHRTQNANCADYPVAPLLAPLLQFGVFTMFDTLDFIEILSVILVALATALAIAHALEMPGKMRLKQREYMTMQHVYYPTFTIAGAIGEVGGLLVTLIMMFTWRYGSAPFWLSFIGVSALLSMQVVYWAMTHPVQKYWVRGQELAPAAAGFFAFNPMERIEHETRPPTTEADWKTVRERWEYSHLIRAALGLIGLISVVTAVAI